MTKIILGITMAICLSAAVAQAAEYDRNPDRFSSLGFDLTLGGTSGTSDFKASGLTTSQDISSGLFQLGVDARIPVSQSNTLSMGLALVGTAFQADETTLLNGVESSDGGFILNFGFRHYFNQ